MPVIFTGLKYDKDKIMGREYSLKMLPLEDSIYFLHVEQLSRQLNLGEAVQVEIDRHMICMHAESTRSPILERIPRELLVLKHEHVFSLGHLPDIGRYVSRLVINLNHSSTDLMSRLIHYSMPYIKHNRYF